MSIKSSEDLEALKRIGQIVALALSVIRQLCGHGIGRTIHEEPQVPNYADVAARGRLHEGLVITVEPIIAAGSGEPVLSDDGWTVKTADGSLAAHYEHTLVITKDIPILLTEAA
ncbi:MAG: M24 family metallopeptidase [Terriglobia bacterium]